MFHNIRQRELALEQQHMAADFRWELERAA